jgi:hypothetical protein
VAAVIVAAGIAAVLLALLGRPGVSVSSGQDLVQVHLDGAGTGVTSVRVTSDGRPLPLKKQGAGYVPVTPLPQNQQVDLHASAAPPGWLRWLLGSGVSTSAVVRTPSAAPTANTAVTSRPGTVAVSFSRPVSVVSYRAAGGPARVLRLSRPSATAQLTVPGHQSGGGLTVAGAPWPWERAAAQATAVNWLSAPVNGVPVAITSPAPDSTDTGLNSPVTLTFDEPVAKALGPKRPVISPATPGTWTEPDADTLTFTPTGTGFAPGTPVTVSFGRPVTAVSGSARETVLTSASSSYHFSVTQPSVLRVQQILARLRYLPLNFTPARGVREPTTLAGEAATLGNPLKGTFSWRWSAPGPLRDQWRPGAETVMVKGALMAFMSATEGSSFNGYTATDASTAQLVDASWEPLLRAAAANQADPQPYSYVYVSENLPEKLVLWENGTTVLTSAANTGEPAAPTATGTYPVYVRFTFNYMSGHNPDGSYYHDPVYWINYFNGGDAVHGFERGSYGSPQSLGCVELPVPTAHVAFDHLAIGDLVTVAP